MNQRKMGRTRTILLGLILFVAATSAACGSSGGGQENKPVAGAWADVIAAAENEGAVTIYSSQVTDQLQALKVAFEKKYPKIELQYVRGAGDAGVPKVEAEARIGRGIADILVTPSANWLETHSDLFAPVRGPAFDAADYNRAENIATKNYYVISAFIVSYGWNTELHPKEIKDWQGLLAPELGGGKIGVVTPDSPTKVDFYDFLEATHGPGFLQKLAAQQPRIYPSVQPVTAALTSGEIAAGIFLEPLTDEKKSGAPVDWRLSGETWGTRFYAVNLKAGPHPNAGLVLADFMVTKEGQEAVARNAASVLPDVSSAVETTKNILHKQDPAKLTPQRVREFRSEFEQMFGR
jgi:iron(III) transport system substrate-binding protein